MIGKEKAAELHKRYGQFEYPIDSEDIATREGLMVTTWPFLSPVDEVKVGHNVGIREGLSSEWRRWDIAHALGHHLLHSAEISYYLPPEIRRKQEQEAEEFAAYLLMPEEELQNLTGMEMGELAGYFGVPEEMVGSRL